MAVDNSWPVVFYIIVSSIEVAPVVSVTDYLTADATSHVFKRGWYSSNRTENHSIAITADSSNVQIRFRLVSTDLTAEELCQHGGIDVFAGGNFSTGLYIGSFCGASESDRFVVTDSSVVIILNGSVIPENKSFTISYDSQEGSCGGLVSAVRSARYVRAPDYPLGHGTGNTSVCSWVLMAVPTDRVRVILRYTAPHQGCTRNSVTVLDGTKYLHSARHLATWCGDLENNQFVSFSQTLGVQSQSQGQLHVGLEVEFHSEQAELCQQHLRVDHLTSGVLASPGFPLPFPDWSECRWEIHANRKEIIRLTVLESGLGESPGCTRDYVKIYPHNELSGVAMVTWCRQHDQVYEFYIPSLLVVVKTGRNQSQPRSGLQIKYETVEEPLCGGNLTADIIPKTFSSRGYPTPFQGFQKCKWLITASSPGRVVKLRGMATDLFDYDSYHCDYEKVTVFDGVEETGRPLGYYCRDSTPSYRSRTSSLTVVFTAGDNAQHRKGFLAEYMEDSCGETVYAYSFRKHLTTPGHPGTYPSNLDCYWHLTTSDSNTVVLTFQQVDLHCPHDRATIYNGIPKSASVVWGFCGADDHSYLSYTSHVTVQLHTETTRGTGFTLTYEKQHQNEGCNADIWTFSTTAGTGSVQSPGHPGNYFDNLHCRWMFSASRGNGVRAELVIEDIKGKGVGCHGDYLKAYDGADSEASVLGVFCSNETVVLESSGEDMYMEFVTDDVTTGLGFVISYSEQIKTVTEAIKQQHTNDPTFGVWLTSAILVVIMVFGFFGGLCWDVRKHRRQSRSNRAPVNVTVNNNVDVRLSVISGADISLTQPGDSGADNSPPPPSYFDISDLPPSRFQAGGDTEMAPPPSYTEAVNSGMIQPMEAPPQYPDEMEGDEETSI